MSSADFLSDAAYHRVEDSWAIVKKDLEEVGLEFLVRIFHEVPAALGLFPHLVQGDISKIKTDRASLQELLSGSKMVRAHARLVMNEVGKSVAGLSDIESLTPRLRSLGRMHQAAGVLPAHYDLFFKHLLGTIEDRLKPLGAWSKDTEEAWRMVQICLSIVMKRPTAVLETEPLGRWEVIASTASCYTVFVTPLRLAGFTSSNATIESGLNLLDCGLAAISSVELFGGLLLSATTATRPSKLRRRLHQEGTFSNVLMKLTQKTVIAMRKLGVDRAAQWPVVDTLILVSFPLERLHHVTSLINSTVVKKGPVSEDTAVTVMGIFKSFFKGRLKCFRAPILPEAVDAIISHETIVGGLPWSSALGLLRLTSIFRLLSAIRSIENSLIISKHADEKKRALAKIVVLLFTISYVVHFSACLWCLVVRLQWWNRGSTEPTPFFPDPDLLLSGKMLNGYTRAVYWAWANLAGIGNVESVPEGTIECIVSLAVHVVGATLYAMATGNIVSMLEASAARESEVASEAAELSDFMASAGVPAKAQDRVMRGYIMQNIFSSRDEQEEPSEELPFPDRAAGNLPSHLQQELQIHALVDSMNRRDRAFQSCSTPFLYALVESLKSSKSLVPGDYLFEQGQEEFSRQLYIIQKGTMEVIVDGQPLKTLSRGDVLGLPWVMLAALLPDELHAFVSNLDDQPEQNQHYPGGKSERGQQSLQQPLQVSQTFVHHTPPSINTVAFSRFVYGTPLGPLQASIRALEACTLLTKRHSQLDFQVLQQTYPKDYDTMLSAFESSYKSTAPSVIP